MSTLSLDQPGYVSRTELTDEIRSFYHEKGFLVVHDALTPEEVQELKSETIAVCRQERMTLTPPKWGGAEGMVIPTREEMEGLTDDEVMRLFLCIHQAHKSSPVLKKYLAHPVIVDVLTRVIGPNVKCMQSMLFIKASGKPGQAWHQDEDFIPTRDRSLAGAWIAMDDAVIENGCLWILPKSQKPGVLWPMYPHDDPRYDCARMSYDFPYKDEDAVPVEVPAGAIVFFNGYTLHKSEPNVTQGKFRRVLVNHYMSGESLLPWFHGSSLDGTVAQADFRDIEFIAGSDPYAYKGTVDVSGAHIRPAGEGGCGDGRTDLETFKQTLLKQS